MTCTARRCEVVNDGRRIQGVVPVLVRTTPFSPTAIRLPSAKRSMSVMDSPVPLEICVQLAPPSTVRMTKPAPKPKYPVRASAKAGAALPRKPGYGPGDAKACVHVRPASVDRYMFPAPSEATTVSAAGTAKANGTAKAPGSITSPRSVQV